MLSTPSSPRRFALDHRTLLLWTLGILIAIVAWDAGGQDIPLARAFGSANGFPLREQWFFVQVLHEGARRLGWLLVLLLALGVWWPWGCCGVWIWVSACRWPSVPCWRWRP